MLLLAKRVGKQAGFTPRAIQLLDYYMAFTRDVDWEEGSRPIVYQSLARTALDMGVSERQVQKLEQQLFAVGAITWNDSGNHKRYGQRDAATGRILYAYGVELTPLAYLRTELEQKLHEKRLYDEAWLSTKREISWHRRQIKALLLELTEQGADRGEASVLEAEYEPIAFQLRTHIRLDELRTLLDRHRSLHSLILDRIGGDTAESEKTTEQAASSQETKICSSRSEPAFVHYQPTTHLNKSSSPKDTSFQESVAGPPEPNDPASSAGLQHVSLSQILVTASERFHERLPLRSGPINWSDAIEAAYQLRRELGVSQGSWAEACGVLGRAGAAVCVVVTDQALSRETDPVRMPAAYFRGMVKKAVRGELRLHNSVYGLSDAGKPRCLPRIVPSQLQE